MVVQGQELQSADKHQGPGQMNFYCFENTDKTNRFDSDWCTRQKQYKNKNIIIVTSKESRRHEDDDDDDVDDDRLLMMMTYVYRKEGLTRKEDMSRLMMER